MSRRAIRKRRHRYLFDLVLVESDGAAWVAFEAQIKADYDRLYSDLLADITIRGGGSYAAAEVMRTERYLRR